ncbi:hypothetical protein [Novosphingobium sp. KN65.2]|uniref:hypothetical protein n=1 Tax=Novosphingobium sp. KN65.2 TaxID=1478134 RepID=UPI0005E7358C|nr:hypothetical protein [Novosphingobium sp. KN65.2]CDO38639.1 exported hypothetical protein [Novosphingobium sp. KN65.2]
MSSALHLLALLLLATPQARPNAPPPASLDLPKIRDQFLTDMRCEPAFAPVAPPADPQAMAASYLVEATLWRENREKRKPCPAG